MTYSTQTRRLDDLGAEWWDNSVLNPSEKKGKPDLYTYNLAPSVRADIEKDGNNMQQYLPEEYRFVSDVANLLVDRAQWLDVKTEVPHDQVDLVMTSTSNYIKEDMKYKEVMPTQTDSEILRDIRTGVDRLDEVLAARVDDAMENDMIMGDGAPG